MTMTEKHVVRPFGKVPTEKLVFALKVGKTGLTTWRGPRVAEVKRHLAEIEKRLTLRKIPPSC